MERIWECICSKDQKIFFECVRICLTCRRIMILDGDLCPVCDHSMVSISQVLDVGGKFPERFLVYEIDQNLYSFILVGDSCNWPQIDL